MSGIDSRIIVIGIPQVAAALNADAEQAIWFTQSYIFGSTVALLFIGRVSDIMGRVRIYTLGFSIFTVGSALTSLSPSPDYVIAFRVLQGFGSAALFANSAAIITDSTPGNQLGLFLGFNMVAFRVGAMLGLTVSGLILTVLDWRALFYINIPIGIFGTYWAHRRLTEVSKRDVGSPMDWIGFATFSGCIISFLLALTYAAYGTFPFPEILVLAIVSIGFGAAFVMRERSFPHPLLDLGLLKIREFTGGVVAQMLNSLAWGAVILLLSLYLQLVKGLTPLYAGLSIIPFDLAFLVVGPLSGRFSDKYGHLPFTTTGLAIQSGSLLLMSTTTVDTPYPILAAYLVLFGIGVGIFSSPNMSSIMGSVPPPERGIASGFRATFFNVGYVLSFNLAILVMTAALPYSVITSVISSTNPSTIIGVDKTLFAKGLDYAFVVSAAINAIAIIPSVLRGKRIAQEPGAPSGAGEALD